MSWSYHGSGFPQAIIKDAKSHLNNQRCEEPEETLKSMALLTITTALGSFPANVPVKVSAGGSQSKDGSVATNQFNLVIEPIWGFKDK